MRDHLHVLAKDKAINDGDEYLNGRTDCVDNASNRTNFLSILEALDLSPEWRIDTPEVRQRFDIRLVHWTAVVTDERNGTPWSIDSWFRLHGHLP